jgi:hypothetical protein
MTIQWSTIDLAMPEKTRPISKVSVAPAIITPKHAHKHARFVEKSPACLAYHCVLVPKSA